ncbi:uncharacterized protein LOC121279149 isoform X1 [Carcharodon carcharias]|uniref:uncharacterized protein LOC121279149 isoform X1 n=1 Tax=Carcharodon carcharias TaxID=13397 RepID=UPI001B7F1457|nr:uncharacterized protein LOC121279149 isoform X1 [Carcharodon carcharias]
MSYGMAQSDLRRHYYALSTSMSPTLVEQITYFLYSTRILSQYELNVISSKSEMLSKASELLSAVLRKGKKACGIFFQALEMSDPHLSKEITGKQVNSTGHTPQAPSLLGLAPSTKPHVSKLQSTVEASLSQKGHSHSPVICKICICNSNLNNCIFGSNNNLSIMSAMSLSDPDNFEEPTPSTNLEPGEALDMKSPTCGSSNEKDTSSTEAVQVESDIKILRCKVRNMTVGNRNTFTVVEESSDEGDNEEKEREEEYEENESEEKDDAEQLTNERG